MGGSFTRPNGVEVCCDVCTPSALDTHLDILQPGPYSRAKPHRAVREISDELHTVLRTRLLEERDAIFVEKPGLGIFGKEFVFPDKTISLLCKQASYVKSVSDVSLYGIEHPDIKGRLFNVIMDVTSDAPPPKRRHTISCKK